MKRTRLTVLLVTLFLAIAGAVAVILLLPCRDAWTSSRRLSDALRHARSITLVEFTRGMISGELVFARVVTKDRFDLSPSLRRGAAVVDHVVGEPALFIKRHLGRDPLMSFLFR